MEGGLNVPGYMEPLIGELLGIMQGTVIIESIHAEQMLRPCMMLKPSMKLKPYTLLDGTIEYRWCAKYGDVEGWGNSPEKAFEDFDATWKKCDVE